MSIPATQAALVSETVDDLEKLAALRPAIEAWRRNPFYWATLFHIDVPQMMATIDQMDRVCRAAGVLLDGKAA